LLSGRPHCNEGAHRNAPLSFSLPRLWLLLGMCAMPPKAGSPTHNAALSYLRTALGLRGERVFSYTWANMLKLHL
jgi:hypothetical protein